MLIVAKGKRRLYKWAATIFSSRSFPSSAVAHQLIAQDDTKYNYPNKDSFHALHESSSSKWPVLIPGLDLLNHIPSAKVTWNWGRLVCSITVDELVTGSSQIWNNYGPKNNEERAAP